MRSVRIRDMAAEPHVSIPPGAYVARFHQPGELVATESGVDCHPTGARLIKVVVHLGTVSSSPVVLSIKKNDEQVMELTIPPNETPLVRDVNLKEEGGHVMDFMGLVDTLRVELVDPGAGASDLTVLGVFDR